MPLARVFFPQEALETWLADGRGHVVGETLFLDSQPFHLTTALRFMNEVAGGGDETRLVGRVQTLEQIVEAGGEHASTSVVLGDNAYEVVEGYLAEPELSDAATHITHERIVKLFQKK
jgi:hypothetical protein